MKLGRRTVYALLLGLICFNILIRLPRTEHESGVDSFFIHNLASAISREGYAPWILNGLGYFGWYPLSYPSAGPFLIAGSVQLTGISEEAAILALSTLYGVLGVLGAFVMARVFRPDDTFALTAATVFSVAPRFIAFTLWSGSSRSLFMALIPFFIWALIRSHRQARLSHLVILISVLTIMLATHRLTILLAVVVIAFAVAYVFILAHRVLRIRFPRVLLARRFRQWIPRLTLLFIFGTAAVMLLGTEILKEYSVGEVCSGDSLNDQLCNLGVSITRSVGLALPFALAGVFICVRERDKGFPEAFLVLSLLALVPTLFLRQYTGFYILPFLAVFAAFGVVGLTRLLARYHKARNALAVASVLAISGFSVAVVNLEVERGTSMSNANYSTALYLLTLPEGNFVANDGLVAIRIGSVAGRESLPIGGAGTSAQSPQLLIMGAIDADTVVNNSERVPLQELTIEDDSPFELIGVDALTDWVVFVLSRSVTDVRPRIVSEYGLQYYVENDDLRGQYTAFGNVYTVPEFGKFARSVHESRYKLYDGSSEDVYLAFPPLER